jgi:diguanylate cyclase (GGDEF)-like protein
VVDDEKMNIELLHHGLKDLYTVIAVKEGGIAFDVAKRERPDLILLDIIMPDMDGYEICKLLKNDPETKDIAIIFVTGKDALEDELIGLNLGAIDYFRKPLSTALVRARIKNQIELIQKTRQLEEMAWVDGLTGIWNRRMFNTKFAEACRYAQRNKRAISVMLIDIDYFKQYNDNYGHAAGDEVLVKVAKALLLGAGRPFDTVARYGGEEFIILLNDVHPQDGALVGEKVRELVEGLDIEHKFSSIHKVLTVSVGVASSGQTNEFIDQEALLKLADKCLYEAKGAGRNCVISTDFRPTYDELNSID